MNKVMIVGTGNVGASLGYCLVNQQTPVNELVLTDIMKEDAEGEALDLQDALAVSPADLKVHAGGYEQAGDADIVVITAGVPQKPGETRMQLLEKNASIFKDMVGEIINSGFSGIFIVVSNPMDVMTYLTWKYSGFDSARVLGSGTVLDSARLRQQIAKKLSVDPKSVHAYQVGEHGDSGFALWSTATVGGERVTNLISYDDQQKLEDYARREAYEIINRKGATFYGIGACVTEIISAILSDKHKVLPVSSYDDFTGVYNGFPAIVGKSGVERRLNIPMTEEEGIKFQKSVNALKSAIGEINL
ncbi:MAG: L-lactate dehydrogenase [Candidatus Saccharibacteria bacterium]|nr:L-lactate dehydrogenase [Candidatus Saccharibacteria bacterium]